MSDIDFDELDREVNKLVKPDDIEQDDKSHENHDEIKSDDLDQDQVSDKDQDQDQNEEKDEDKDKDKDSDQSQDDKYPSSFSEKSRGRFMDVMHLSSDMNTSEMSDESSQSLKGSDRKSLQPASFYEQKDNTDSQEDSNSEEKIERDSFEDTDTESSTTMPDPIDVFESNSSEDEADEQKDESSAEESNDQEEIFDYEAGEDEKEDEKEDEEPHSAENLFLSGAKVDKRPLGQFSDQKDEVPAEVVEVPSVSIDTIGGAEVDENDDPADLKSPIPSESIVLPPELEKELVAIEAGESPEMFDKPKESEADKDNSDKESEESDKEEDKKPEKETAKNTPATLLATGSIPQQYKLAIEKKYGEEEHSQLFDSQNYDKIPSSAPKKSKSSTATLLHWVLIVIGLLLLGGGIGGLLFVFMMNH